MDKRRIQACNEKTVSRTCADWQQKEFKPTHCTQLIEMMAKGQSHVHFCADNRLSNATFYRWLGQYPDLKLAYDIGKSMGKAYMLTLLDTYNVETSPQEGVPSEKLNIAIWKERMKYSFEQPERREATMMLAYAAKATAESPRTMMTAVLEGLRCGLYDTDEATKLANLIETAQRVTETAELTKRIEEIEKALGTGSKVEDFKEEIDVNEQGS